MAGMYKIMTLGVTTLLVLAGCADRGMWVGEWRGERSLLAPPGSDPAVAVSLAKIKLTISTDGSFELTEEGFTKSGSADLGSDSGTLHVTRMLNRSIGNIGSEAEKYGGDRTVKLQKDGTMIFIRAGADPVVLQRKDGSK